MPKLGPGTYYNNAEVDEQATQPTFQLSLKGEGKLSTGTSSLTKIQTARTSGLTKALTPGKCGNVQSHYKLKQKAESYSCKGFGNGFASKADRFSGVHEAKFQIIAWFRNRGLQKAEPKLDA